MPDFMAFTAPNFGRVGWALYGQRLWVRTPMTLVVSPSAEDPVKREFKTHLDVDVLDGRLVCTSLRVEAVEGCGEITSEAIRTIPVAQWVALGASKFGLVQQIRRASSGGLELVRFEMPSRDFASNGMTDDALEAISQIYAFCMATGQKPTGVLAGEFNMSRPTASRWIATARHRGILVDEHQKIDLSALRRGSDGG